VTSGLLTLQPCTTTQLLLQEGGKSPGCTLLSFSWSKHSLEQTQNRISLRNAFLRPCIKIGLDGRRNSFVLAVALIKERTSHLT